MLKRERIGTARTALPKRIYEESTASHLSLASANGDALLPMSMSNRHEALINTKLPSGTYHLQKIINWVPKHHKEFGDSSKLHSCQSKYVWTCRDDLESIRIELSTLSSIYTDDDIQG